MKKTDKEFERKFEQDLEQYFDSIEIPKLSEERKKELRKKVEANKPIRKRITLWRRITAIASAMCLIAIIIVPTVILLNKKDNPTPPPEYYGKAEATKIRHTLEETQDIISINFPKYNFIFEDLNYLASVGYYNPTNNELLSLEIQMEEKAAPFTSIEMNIVASEQFTFENTLLYTNDAECTITSECKIYKKVHQETFSEVMYGYIIFENHELYLNLNIINESLFNKFI